MGGVPVGASAGHQIMSKPSQLLLHPHHLVARFVVSLDTRPPDPADDAWARSQLLPGEWALWAQQSNVDRKHTVKVARRFVQARPTATRAEIAGALLHDIGKLECGLGTWGRVLASVVGPRTARFRAYHDHERIGAELVAAAGGEPETVDLVAERGPAFAALEAADRA